MVISQIFGNRLVIPDFPAFTQQIADIFESCKNSDGGKVIDHVG